MLRTVVLAALTAGVFFFSGPALAGTISVGPNVHVSGSHAGLRHAEVLVTADPENANDLIGCSILYLSPAKTRTIVYRTADGGAHWKATLTADQGLYTGDPACAYGTNGRAYFATLGSIVDANGHDKGTTVVYRSSDGGVTWPAFVTLPESDREYLAVDTGSGRYAGHVYVNATMDTRVMDVERVNTADDFITAIGIQHSGDGGATFAPPMLLSDKYPHYVIGMGNGVVLSDGTYAAVFGDLKNAATGWDRTPPNAEAWLKTVTSNDGGESFSAAHVISEWHFCDISHESNIPSMAADNTSGPFHGRLYAAWNDARSGRCEILLAQSSDKGKTWSAPVIVNDDYPRLNGAGPDDFTPVVAVNGHGVVGVSWCDRRESPDDNGYRVRFAASFDGGETFTNSVPVSTALTRFAGRPSYPVNATTGGGGSIFDYQRGGPLSLQLGLSDFAFSGGHTQGMAADAVGRFHPFWIDDRTGLQQVWSAAVTVDGVAVKNGSPELSAYTDATQDVYLDTSDPVYDAVHHTVSVNAQLLNTSKKTITGPFLARALTLTSGLGRIVSTNADGGNARPGAIWHFHPASGGDELKPHEATESVRLVFRLTNVRPVPAFGPRDQHPMYVSLTARVLAGAVR